MAEVATREFVPASRAAVKDEQLRQALRRAGTGFDGTRRKRSLKYQRKSGRNGGNRLEGSKSTRSLILTITSRCWRGMWRRPAAKCISRKTLLKRMR